jgi:hypothetical protein
MKPKKKFAVLLAGMLREFDYAYQTWPWLNYNNCDIFVSTWDIAYETNEMLNINIKEEITADKILKIFPNATINIEPEVENELHNSEKQLYHWKKLFDMVENSKYEYDGIVLTRSDLYLEVSNDKFIELFDNLNDEWLYALGNIIQYPPPELIFVQDLLFVGKFDVMKNNLLTFSYGSFYVKNIHYWLAKHLVINDVYVSNIMHDVVKNYCVLRSVCRDYVKYHDTYQLRRLSEDWYNRKHTPHLFLQKEHINFKTTKSLI